MVQTPVSGKNGPATIQPGDRNNWFATRPADYRDFVSFVLLTLPGLLRGLPGLKVQFGKV